MVQVKPDLDRLKKQGDPPADEVIAMIQQRRGATVVFELIAVMSRWMPGEPFDSLEPELVAFLQQPCADPPWLVRNLVHRAQENYQRDKNPARVVLGVYSLPSLYLDPDIALALIGTGQLSIHVRPRLQHTQDFVDAVMTPGSLDEAGAGWLWIRKVRLTHAIRRALAKLPRNPGRSGGDEPLSVLRAKAPWHHRDDEPIDQLELAYVMLSFAWVVVDGVSRLGPRYRMKRDVREAHVHAWAVIGHMLGIVDELLPGIEPGGSDVQAGRLFETLRDRYLQRGDPLPAPGRPPPPGVEEGRQLMAALMVVLVDVARESIPASFRDWVAGSRWLDNALQDLPRMLLYKLAGTQTARMLHVTPAPLLHWIVCRLVTLVYDLRAWNTGPPPPGGT